MTVIVYSTPDCPYCGMVKSYLMGKGVEFTEYDVSKDPAKGREMVEKSKQGGVPVCDINGRTVVGFDRAAIDKALTMKRVDPAIMKQNLTFDLFDH